MQTRVREGFKKNPGLVSEPFQVLHMFHPLGHTLFVILFYSTTCKIPFREWKKETFSNGISPQFVEHEIFSGLNFYE